MSNIQECKQLQILFKLKNEFISLAQLNVQSNVQVIIRLRVFVSIGNVIPNDSRFCGFTSNLPNFVDPYLTEYSLELQKPYIFGIGEPRAIIWHPTILLLTKKF